MSTETILDPVEPVAQTERVKSMAKAIVVVVLTVAFTIYLSGYLVVPAAAIIALAAVGIVVICRLPVASDEQSLLSSARPARDRVASL